MYAAIDVESKIVLHARRSRHRGRESRRTVLVRTRTESRISGAGVSRRCIGYLTAPARTNLTDHFDYSERKMVEKLLQVSTVRIEQFHRTCNDSQTSVERWPSAYYNHTEVTKHSKIGRQSRRLNKRVRPCSSHYRNYIFVVSYGCFICIRSTDNVSIIRK